MKRAKRLHFSMIGVAMLFVAIGAIWEYPYAMVIAQVWLAASVAVSVVIAVITETRQ